MFALSWYVLLLLVSGAQIPKEPDFSGQWVLVEPTGATSDPAPALVVRQRVTRTTSRGEPMTPYYSHLVIERHFSDRVEQESYEIGVVSGNVSGIGERTTEAVTWQGERLVIRTGRYSGPPQQPGPYAEHEEVWSLDPTERLVIAITDRTADAQPAKGRRVIYQRRAAARWPITTPAVQTASDLELDSAVTADDRDKYRSIRDAKDWENPFLVILKDGVDVRAKGFRRTLPLTELRRTLVSLPVSAWPYGAVAAVEEQHLRAVDGADDAAIRANLEEALAVLTALKVRADRWP